MTPSRCDNLPAHHINACANIQVFNYKIVYKKKTKKKLTPEAPRNQCVQTYILHLISSFITTFPFSFTVVTHQFIVDTK